MRRSGIVLLALAVLTAVPSLALGAGTFARLKVSGTPSLDGVTPTALHLGGGSSHPHANAGNLYLQIREANGMTVIGTSGAAVITAGDLDVRDDLEAQWVDGTGGITIDYAPGMRITDANGRAFRIYLSDDASNWVEAPSGFTTVTTPNQPNLLFNASFHAALLRLQLRESNGTTVIGTTIEAFAQIPPSELANAFSVAHSLAELWTGAGGISVYHDAKGTVVNISDPNGRNFRCYMSLNDGGSYAEVTTSNPVSGFGLTFDATSHVQTVPNLSEVGFVALVLLLMGSGVFYLRRSTVT